jgi:hypothetical protein
LLAHGADDTDDTDNTEYTPATFANGEPCDSGRD